MFSHSYLHHNKYFYLSYVDLTTGECFATKLENKTALINELISISAKEIVLPKHFVPELRKWEKELKVQLKKFKNVVFRKKQIYVTDTNKSLYGKGSNEHSQIEFISYNIPILTYLLDFNNDSSILR